VRRLSLQKLLFEMCLLWGPLTGLFYTMYHWFWLPTDLAFWLMKFQYPVESSWFYMHQWIILVLVAGYGWLAGMYCIMWMYTSVRGWLFPAAEVARVLAMAEEGA
jgi:hypothetical protein